MLRLTQYWVFNFLEQLWHDLLILEKIGVVDSLEIMARVCLLAAILCTKLDILARLR